MGRVAQFGVYVEILGTLGIALILRSTASTTASASSSRRRACEHAATNPLGLDFHGSWFPAAALIAVLAPVYIFYGFESAGDIAEETKDAGRQMPRGDAAGR